MFRTGAYIRLAGLSEQLHEFLCALFPKRNDFLDKLLGQTVLWTQCAGNWAIHQWAMKWGTTHMTPPTARGRPSWWIICHGPLGLWIICRYWLWMCLYVLGMDPQWSSTVCKWTEKASTEQIKPRSPREGEGMGQGGQKYGCENMSKMHVWNNVQNVRVKNKSKT